MFWRICRVLSVFLLVLSLGSVHAQELSDVRYTKESTKLLTMFHDVSPGIVYIYTGLSKATGFFVTKDGWILTAGHGVDYDFPEVGRVWVKFDRMYDSVVFEATEIIRPPLGVDLMLVKIDCKPKFFFKKFRRAVRFEEVWVFGFRGSSSKVPSVGYMTWTTQSRVYQQCTANVNYGNSGSPVLNRSGAVVGLIVMGLKASHDGLLIPSTVIAQYLAKNGIKVELK